MVLDTRTLNSLHSLAAVVRSYTAPGETPETPDRRSRIELTPEQKKDGCMLRFLHGWHVHHIAEALGIANSNYSFNWEDNMVEALEECAVSDYWNSQRLRLQPGAQISKEGPNQYGAARQSALRNAIAEVLIQEPKQRTAATKDDKGKDIPGTSLMDRAFKLIDDDIEDKSYLNSRPPVPGRQNLNRYIRDLEALGFRWEGAGRRQIMADLPEETREAIDNEIRRQCRVQVAEGATITRKGKERPAPLNYSAIARDVYKNFIIDEELQDTMEYMGYDPILPTYVRQLCQDAKITVDIRTPFADQAKDEANIKLVKDERERDPKSTAWQIYQRTGLQLPIVQMILDALGLPRGGRKYTTTDIRKIILAAHDTERLTVEGMLEKHPELAEYFVKNVIGAAAAVRAILRRSGRTPHTDITLEAEITEPRRILARAAQLKSAFVAHLGSWDEQELERIRGNITRGVAAGRSASSMFEETGHTVDSLATRLQETPEFIQKVIALLEVETPQLIALLPANQTIIFPYTALRWITRGGATIEGEVE